MKIYTRTGDEGQTSLFAGGRISKDHPRLHAYGTIDELNSFLGLAAAQGLSPQTASAVNAIQNELLILGADMATPMDAQSAHIKRMTADRVSRLEAEIDSMEDQLEPLKTFILPGGTLGASTLHVARTVCRRAERWIVALSESETINPVAQQYVNRLSDWLFVAARFENKAAGREDVIWKV